MSKPNFVFFLSDEESAPYSYESQELKEWRKNNLKMYSFFEENAINFSSHRTTSSGCRPARADLNTGLSYLNHGVTCTDGLSKTESEVTFIDPKITPTLGNRLKKEGYHTYYEGKQHLTSDTNNLEEYGYSGYSGPEPHGQDLTISAAYFRDKKYVQNVLNLLPNLQQPYCLFISLINPHDIVYWTGYNMRQYPIGKLLAWFFNIDPINYIIDQSVPIPPDGGWPTDTEELDSKPSTQTKFREVYKQILSGPIFKYFHNDRQRIRQFYYTLIKDVQTNFWTIFQELQKLNSYTNTYFFYTSDHGDMNGSHGGLYQKWYSMYEEIIKVPCYVFHPLLEKQVVNVLTCHYDFVPTILGLANIKCDDILLGKDLSPYILKNRKWSRLNRRRIEFNTLDDITNGKDCYQIAVKRTSFLYFLGFGKYQGIKGNRIIKAQIKSTKKRIYKYAKYFNPDNHLSLPEEEMYEIISDPYERKNLAQTNKQKFGKIKKKYFSSLVKIKK